MGKQKSKKIPVKSVETGTAENNEELKNQAAEIPAEEPAEAPAAAAPEEITEDTPAEEKEAAEETVTLLKSKVEAMKKELQENIDRLVQERADFSNYRKRVERDRDIAAANYKAEVLKKFLVVNDNLELAFVNIPQDEKTAPWAEGITNIIRQFNTLLENEGLTRMNLEPGNEFDPNLAMAVSSEDSDEFESGQIIQVLQDGYRIGDRVIRQAIVRVAA